jgi:hypothetical protein
VPPVNRDVGNTAEPAPATGNSTIVAVIRDAPVARVRRYHATKGHFTILRGKCEVVPR